MRRHILLLYKSSVPLIRRQTILLCTLILLLFQESQAEDFIFNQESKVSTGKIIIDGVVVGEQNQAIIKGSGKHSEENRALPDFIKIKVIGSVDIIYNQNSATSVKITGDDNIIHLIETNVNGDTLNISTKKSYTSQLPISLQITSPDLHAVFLDGSGKFIIDNINSQQLSIDISGSSDITASGKVNNLDIQLSGSGDVNTKALDANDVTINIIGSGDLRVTAHKKLAATILGSGEISYFGNPGIIEKNIIGVGDIVRGE